MTMNNYEFFAKHLIEKIENQLSLKDQSIILGKIPDDEIFLGAFSEVGKEKESNKEMIYPNFIGLHFNVLKDQLNDNSIIKVDFYSELFYRIAPTYKEQIDYLSKSFMNLTNIKMENITFDTIVKYYFSKHILDSEKIQISELRRTQIADKLQTKFPIDFDDLSNKEKELIYNSFDRFLLFEVEKTLTRRGRELEYKYKKFLIDDFPQLELIYKDSLLVPKNKNFNEQFNNILSEEKGYIKDMLHEIKPPRYKDLLSEEAYHNYLSNQKDISEHRSPNWQAKIDTKIIENKESFFVEVIFSNENSSLDNKYSKYKHPYSSKMFNSKIKVSVDRNYLNDKDVIAFDTIEVADILDKYRYNVEKYATPLNCGVEYIYENNCDILESQNFTIYKEKRRVTRKYENISLEFEDFVNKPVVTLENIFVLLEKEKEIIFEYINKYKSQKDIYNEAYKDYIELDKEIKRFEFGIEALKNFPKALNAFIHLNETFYLDSKSYTSWRLFQIVFIVSNIPDIIVSHYGKDELSSIRKYQTTDLVDILYFPTGGGKTEAFLGSVIFTLFFDRLRGKNKGMSAIIKYPLRLLSIQQVDRVLKKMSSAQIVKNNHNIKGDLFSLGYFVGSGNTPNKHLDGYFVAKDKLEKNIVDYQQINLCPICNSEVKLKVDVDNEETNHYCTNSCCIYNNKIPYLFIDYELYNNPPSILISTLDKFAIMAFNNDFTKLLHTNDSTCFDPVPTLSIIDEIHLIKESLGTFASHYESFFYYFCSDLIKDFNHKAKKIKYMGATATISNYKEQSRELFMKEATLFPAISPKVEQDFYSEIDENNITRFNIVIMPFGTSSIRYITKLIEIQRRIISNYLENPEQLQRELFNNEISLGKVLEILYNYYIMIQYSNTKRDASRVRSGLSSYVNLPENLDEKYYLSTDTLLTGDTKFGDVKNLLTDIANSKNPVEDDIPNYITATSMISHGVDNKKFNSMYFLGIPFLFAEYIQASSRVGRTYTGIVFNVIRPIRVREESFLSNFTEYLTYRELMITPIPINRYAIGGLKKTFNGLLLSLMRQYMLPLSKHVSKLKNYNDFVVLLEEFRERPVTKIMKKIYNHGELSGEEFDSKVTGLVKETFAFIRYRENLEKYSRYPINNIIEQVNTSNEKALRSLRDTDEGIIIKLGD